MFKWLSDMKSFTKLIFGFALVGAIMGFVGYLGIKNMGIVNNGARIIYEENVTGIKVAGELQYVSQLIRARVLFHLLQKDPAVMAKVEEDIKAEDGRVAELWKMYEPLVTTEKEKEVWTQYQAKWAAYRKMRDTEVLPLSKEGKKVESIAAMKQNTENFFSMMKTLKDLAEKAGDDAKHNFENGQKVYESSKKLMIGIVFGGISLGLFIGWMIARQINKGISQVVMVAGKAAERDLTGRIQLDTNDDIGQMGKSFNAMLDKMSSVIGEVANGSENVMTASTQISQGNDNLSQRTSEQAGALEETSSAMEEMTSTVKMNADNAKQANQLALSARETAEKGGSVTAQAVTAMSEVNKSSKKIVDIITVIDEIAFQTNLLALNAAVEAARAGEHGRGFAVVAAEVRNLAQRSATAAKEIKGLINESVQKVSEGSELVNQSGKTLNEIVDSVKKVTDIIGEISASAQEQASGIDQVNKAIMQMDETTQQNAALVEEAASASQAMKEQAEELMRQVEMFKISTETTHHEKKKKTQHSVTLSHHASPKPAQRRRESLVHSSPGKAESGSVHAKKDESEHAKELAPSTSASSVTAAKGEKTSDVADGRHDGFDEF